MLLPAHDATLQALHTSTDHRGKVIWTTGCTTMATMAAVDMLMMTRMMAVMVGEEEEEERVLVLVVGMGR